MKSEIAEKASKNHQISNSLDGIINVLERGMKQGKNLNNLRIEPLALGDISLELTNEDKKIIKGKANFKKHLEQFDKIINKSGHIKNNSAKNLITDLSSLPDPVKEIEGGGKCLDDYSDLLEKLTNGFENLYTAIDHLIIVPPATSREWNGFVKKALKNEYFLSNINFIQHELLSVFVCHGFIVEHAGKRRLSKFAAALLENEKFNPYEGSIFEKYPLLDIRNTDYYSGLFLRKNSFIKAVIKKYYGIKTADFKIRFLEKKNVGFK